MKQELKLFLKGILVMLLLAVKSLPCNAIGAYGAVDFNRLTNRNGLSNSQVNAIFKDQKGYLATFSFNVPAYPGRKVIIRDMARDKQGHMWMKTIL